MNVRFEVTVIKENNGEAEQEVFDLYHDALNYIDSKMSHWNNFNPEVTLHIYIKKIPSDTETLHVMASDVFKVGEVLSG
jgi:hypothetical protein